LDSAKRLALIDQADRLLWADLPMVPLFQRPLLFAVRSAYVNIGPNVASGAYWNVEQWARKAAK
jgi:ABC-type transport system substrate-binding protein